MGEYRHGGESPGIGKRVLPRMGDSHMFMPLLHSYKPREIERLLLPEALPGVSHPQTIYRKVGY